MTSFIIYSLEIAISLALFYTAYWVFLKNDTFFKLNRLYLLATVLLSLLMPLLNITLVSDKYSFLARHLFSPLEQYKQQINEATDHWHMPPQHRGRNTRHLVPQEAETASELSE